MLHDLFEHGTQLWHAGLDYFAVIQVFMLDKGQLGLVLCAVIPEDQPSALSLVMIGIAELLSLVTDIDILREEELRVVDKGKPAFYDAYLLCAVIGVQFRGNNQIRLRLLVDDVCQGGYVITQQQIRYP